MLRPKRYFLNQFTNNNNRVIYASGYLKGNAAQLKETAEPSRSITYKNKPRYNTNQEKKQQNNTSYNTDARPITIRITKRDKSNITYYNFPKGKKINIVKRNNKPQIAIKTINITQKDRYNITQARYINNFNPTLDIHNLFLRKSVFMVKKGKEIAPNTDNKPSTKKVNQGINDIPIKVTSQQPNRYINNLNYLESYRV
ncbi:Uncharacterized protein HZ326_20232 [Fusarium oxysporum f. sp. albedinis]|nr:Uncharacterized protein HZ326_20232 [Fusarium oxysporum f. sp. albedinis]